MMKSELIKYKHYLIILAALIIANYVLVPLSEWHDEQQSQLNLVSARYDKTQDLLTKKDLLAAELLNVDKQLKQIDGYLFQSASEDQFKIIAQNKIEKAITTSECSIERIGYKGSQAVVEGISRWSMELRFKGDIYCMLAVTRKLESMKPYVRIDDHNFNHRGLNKKLKGQVNGLIRLSLWHKEVA